MVLAYAYLCIQLDFLDLLGVTSLFMCIPFSLAPSLTQAFVPGHMWLSASSLCSFLLLTVPPFA